MLPKRELENWKKEANKESRINEELQGTEYMKEILSVLEIYDTKNLGEGKIWRDKDWDFSIILRIIGWMNVNLQPYNQKPTTKWGTLPCSLYLAKLQQCDFSAILRGNHVVKEMWYFHNIVLLGFQKWVIVKNILSTFHILHPPNLLFLSTTFLWCFQ